MWFMWRNFILLFNSFEYGLVCKERFSLKLDLNSVKTLLKFKSLSHSTCLEVKMSSAANCPFEENILEIFEQEKCIKIPPHLKNLLVFTGFDNKISLSKLERSDVTEIEYIGRKTVPKLIQKECLETYLGPFSVNPQEFFIFPGHKRMIHEIASYCRNNTSNTQKRQNNFNNSSDSNDSVNNKKIKSQDETLLGFNLSQESPPPSKENEATNTVKEDSPSWDIDNEKHNIQVLLINWLNNFCSRNLSVEESQLVSRELPKLKVHISRDECNHQCFVTCCICLKEHKMFKNSNGLWILSNFNKHFKTHLPLFQKKLGKNVLIGGSLATSATSQTLDYIGIVENPVKQEEFLEEF